ncbi:hypothetical protein [Pseudodesulfovibrio indicus]|uniref:hypothetical protein n=1 Tax=Pseudodesulfovibrio indicus TaxID=1716143 RepID=UPI002931AC34|nr:hypothetical protein [Pseudodesulfovibrio indicus]
MAGTGKTGRPYLRRNTVAGRNLRTALKLLGKTWRKDVHNPSHVRNWVAWADCGLPSSPTTIDCDMREGVPEQRIAAYALCLGLTPEALCSPEANLVALLGASATPGQSWPFIVPGYGERYADRIQEYNRPSYIRELFALMGGVYDMEYLITGVELVHRCTLWIHAPQAHCLLMRGRFVMFGNENPLEARIFRWHNNLHTHYLCENGLELGYTMTVDPLRHNMVRGRNPFWLRGTGMTDRGLADNLPVTFVFRMQRLPLPESMSQEEFWYQRCERTRKRPFLAPGEPDYQRIRAGILDTEDPSLKGSS